MHPLLIQVGTLEIRTYAVMLVLGFVSAFWLAMRRAEQYGYDSRLVTSLQTWILVASVVGARSLFIATEWERYRTQPLLALMFWRGGLVYYGGLIAALAVSIWFGWRHRLPVLPGLDIAAPCIALGQFFGRLGCLAEGCCYGAVTSVPWALSFGNFARDSQPRHPTQLYEALAVLALLFVLERYYWRPGRRPGMVLVAYGYLYGLARFLNETLRDDDRGGLYFGLFTISQCVSLGAIALAAAGHLSLSRCSPPADVAAGMAGRRVE